MTKCIVNKITILFFVILFFISLTINADSSKFNSNNTEELSISSNLVYVAPSKHLFNKEETTDKAEAPDLSFQPNKKVANTSQPELYLAVKTENNNKYSNDKQDLAYLDLDSLERKQEEKQRKEERVQQAEVKSAESEVSREIKKSDKKSEDTEPKKDQSVSGAQTNDPYEDYNRFMYGLNKNIDKYTLKPVAKVYNAVNPPPTKHMVTNFFNNIQDATVLINNLLQNDSEMFAQTLTRLILNTGLGFLGLFDVATDMGFPKNENDYGVTFGKWGMTDSPYFIIPILGPSTIRDTIGTGIGFVVSYSWFLPDDYNVGLTGLYIIDTRSNLFPAERVLETVADDEYLFVRSAYMQRRNYLITGEKADSKRETREEKLIDKILDDDTQDADYDKKLKKLDKLDDLLSK